jgi:hypothetical protein
MEARVGFADRSSSELLRTSQMRDLSLPTLLFLDAGCDNNEDVPSSFNSRYQALNWQKNQTYA